MSVVVDRLRALGVTLPPVPTPVASYVPAVRFGNLVWTSGQLPMVDGALPVTGVVGGAVEPAVAAEQAGIAARNALAAVQAEIGDLDLVRRVVKLIVYVASDPAFTGQAAVANGASQLIGDAFGEAGRHARSAVGVAVLPLGAPVEVELVVEVS